jgi:hypothetical protein
MTTQLKIPVLSQLYDQDFYLWLQNTANLLRENKFEQLDIDNLIEEIEAMGRSEKRSLESNLVIVLLHLLKWKYQPSKQSKSWQSSILEHRRRLRRDLKDSPSLRNYLTKVLAECYQDSCKQAAIETGLSLNMFPLNCPFTEAEILNEDFLPIPD